MHDECKITIILHTSGITLFLIATPLSCLWDQQHSQCAGWAIPFLGTVEDALFFNNLDCFFWNVFLGLRWIQFYLHFIFHTHEFILYKALTTQVHPWLIHVSVWQKTSQYCKVISLQLKKKKKKALTTKQNQKQQQKELPAETHGRGRVFTNHAGTAMLNTGDLRSPKRQLFF